MDVIYINVETNDVLATSFEAMHAGKISGRRMRYSIDLNSTLPLAAEFKFRRGIYNTLPQVLR